MAYADHEVILKMFNNLRQPLSGNVLCTLSDDHLTV